MNNLVIFDGICTLCTRSVQFILRHESGGQLKFTPLQSSTGSRLMREYGFDPELAETFIFISDGKVLTRSDAALRLALHLRGGWRILGVFGILPRPIRNWLYDILARNRYRWFGQYDSCMVPSEDLCERFIID